MFRLVAVIFSLAFFCEGSAIDVKDRVVGGVDASVLSFPFQCSLQKLENHACGCSVFTNNVVITAAHCLHQATQSDINHMQVRAGSNTWSTGGSVKKVAKILVHPLYNPDTMENDVALVLVASNFVFGNTIKPVKLATSHPSEGSSVLVSGWGYKKEGAGSMMPKLLQTSVKYISGKSCSSSKYGAQIKPGMVCAEDAGKDACQGDSGGPLSLPDSGELIGIVSWGEGCAKEGYPGIYSDVVHFGPWITENAKKLK